ncbi:hypothetical protein, partial [Staphylococcus aureus]|uniref:hypothetical protein n=1 Tax=Staphylococcus aureus TaxID=1280 RepID=UPI001BB105D4
LGPLELRLRHWNVLLDCCCVQYAAVRFVLLGRADDRFQPEGYSPVALAMISFETFDGTSA